MAQGKIDEAMQHFAASVEIYPADREGQYYLAHALSDQKRYEEAALHFRAALKADPDYASALNDLAWMWVTEGDPQRTQLGEAISLARRACDLTHYGNATYLETLGAALSEAGRFREAIEMTERAIAAATAQRDQDAAAHLQKQLTDYRAGRSYSDQTLMLPGSSP
jgi:tetratricopeptide (TPR) repeat protein